MEMVNQVETPVKEEEIIVAGGFLYELLKRIFDIIFSLILILVLLIPMVLIAIIVKATSEGPVLFIDKRIGKGNKKIEVWKYRSMYIDAEENMDKYFTEEQKVIWERERKLDDDPRITKIGKFIRKTSLDELPQLYNILFGSLSVVGPRPITEKELSQHFTAYQKEKLLSVKPGLTGYWQVYGRSNVDFESGERQREELAYLPKRGLLFDVKLILLTIPAVLSHKGAQ